MIDTGTESMPYRSPTVRLAVLALALAAGVFALAYLQPTSATDSDGAIALLAAQALLEHRTLDLEVYRHQDGLAYDLDHDYRLRRRGDGGTYYNNLGVPILSVPAVAAARLAGLDMRRQEDEQALQELLSALACAAVFLLLVRLGLLLLPPRPALVTALVTLLGSSLISTMATGLWSLDYAAPLMLAALVHVVRWELGQLRRPCWACLGLLAAAAFLCRPTAAFLFLGLTAYALTRRRLPRRRAVAAAAAAGLLLLVLALLPEGLLPLPRYYSPSRLISWQTPLGLGLFGHLLSPSRGLLIWSPFLLPVLAGAVAGRRRLEHRRLVLMAAVWAACHLLFASTKGMWWGGHSYGPRLMAELMLPAFLLTALVARAAVPGRRPLAAAYLLLSLPAIAVHSGQGLFNEATQRWNQHPDVDRHPEMIFAWRYPQFLASTARLRQRQIDWQRAHLEPLRPGDVLLPAGRRGIFVGWWPPEGDWRWSATRRPAIRFRPAGIDAGARYLLSLRAGALGEQWLIPALDGRPLGRRRFAGFAPRTERFLIPGSWLAAPGERVLDLGLPGARPAARDPRLLGLSFHALSIDPLPPWKGAITYADDLFFLSGWSTAEDGWRWSDGHRARLLLPPREPASSAAELVLRAAGFGRQRLSVRLERSVLCRHQLHGEGVEEVRCPLPAGRPAQPAELVLELPDAAASAGDPRLLGIALYAARLLPAGAPQG